MLAGLHCGFWKNLDDLSRLRKSSRVFMPAMTAEERARRYDGWKKAVVSTIGHSKI